MSPLPPAPRAARTAFIGAYGYGNLGDELCLIEAMAAFPSDRSFAYSVDPTWTQRCVAVEATFNTLAELEKLRPDRIVFGGGGIGTLPGLDIFTGWMRALQKRGAACHFHNIAVAKLGDLGWLDAERRAFFHGITSFSVRDFTSAEIVANDWRIDRIPAITHFPERNSATDLALAAKILPAGQKLLGISIINTQKMADALAANRDRVRALIAPFRGHLVVPIISTIHQTSAEENDAAGFQRFADQFLAGFAIAGREMLDRNWWYENLSPATLKGVIASCSVVISQRKHNCVHGIGAHVPVIGLHPKRDDSLPRTFISLANYLAPGSRYVSLDQPA